MSYNYNFDTICLIILLFNQTNSWKRVAFCKEKQRGCPLLGTNRYTHIYMCIFIIYKKTDDGGQAFETIVSNK